MPMIAYFVAKDLAAYIEAISPQQITSISE
jgi:hypothetical protein